MKRKEAISMAVALVIAGLLPGIAQATRFKCQPIELLELNNLIHVRCSNKITLSGNQVSFIAISKSDADLAARFVSLGIAALLSGKHFDVNIPASSATNTAGCGANNCRTPMIFGLSH